MSHARWLHASVRTHVQMGHNVFENQYNLVGPALAGEQPDDDLFTVKT